jgi:hypothetical protein
MAPSLEPFEGLRQSTLEPSIRKQEEVDPKGIPAESRAQGESVSSRSPEPDRMDENLRMEPEELL